MSLLVLLQSSGYGFAGTATLAGSGTLTADGVPALSGAAALSGSGTGTAAGAPATAGSASTLAGVGGLAMNPPVMLWSRLNGTNGAAITSTNTDASVNFNTSQNTAIATGATSTFDTSLAHTGTSSWKTVSGSPAGSILLLWKAALTGNTRDALYTRAYIYITGSPAAVQRIIGHVGPHFTTGVATTSANLQITTGGVLRTINGAATIATMSTAIATNQWVRVEFDVTGPYSAATVTARLYNTADSSVATETITTSNVVLVGYVNDVRFGQQSAVTNYTMWFDDIAASSEGPVGPAFAGTATLSGSGSLTAAGTPSFTGTATFTADGTLTATAVAAFSDTAVLSGDGTLAATGAPEPTGAAALSGDGTLAATGVTEITDTAALTGTGTLTATGTPAETGTAALTGTGTLTGSGVATEAHTGTATLAGSGTLTATGTPTAAGTAALTGSGALTGTAVSITTGTAQLTGSGALAATAAPTVNADAPLAGAGTLTTSANPGAAQTILLTGSGTLEATGIAGRASRDITITAATLNRGWDGSLQPPSRATTLHQRSYTAALLDTSPTADLDRNYEGELVP